ncbi:MAG: excinuclease ABC subunit UvrA [gamma proteobacterium symbiont of Taylorina sp.]|nr:excinuclease ABC subunit UvrA [gamma proteobacterium symbiont of Taylorina sp.]
MDTIKIQGVRTHNLKNFDLELPRDKLIVITGLSGSGKSSLAFDTIYAEGQRRYVESLSSYARQFLSMMEKPDIDHIEGLSPAISIEQKSTSHNPRSTVGTVTEIYDYLRLLFARAGNPRCPEHHTNLDAQTVSQMVDRTLSLPEGSKLMLLAPVVQSRKGEHQVLFNELKSQGYIRVRIDGDLYELDNTPDLELHKKHTIEVVVDRFKVRNDLKQRLADSFETALELSDGIARIAYMGDSNEQDLTFSAKFACPDCGYSLAELEPRLFSFNNPAGACPNCDGLGVKQFFDENKIIIDPRLTLISGAIRGWDRRNTYYHQMLISLAKHYNFDIETPFNELSQKTKELILYGNDGESIQFVYINDKGRKTTRNAPFEGVIHNMKRRYLETDSNSVREELNKYQTIQTCPECHGSRLNSAARNVFIQGKTLPEVTALSIGDSNHFFKQLKLTGKQGEIAKKIVSEIMQRLDFLVNVGLEYLSLDRSAETLSGGEAQRIRLASQIGAGLVGVMYILDEPSIGLHQRDNQRLLNTLTYLRDLGNTVIVVEHDEDAIRAADYIVDIGPGAGVHGGEIVAQGKIEQILKSRQSITAQFLNGSDAIIVPEQRTQVDNERLLIITGATGNNLKNVDVTIPVGLLTVVTGVSGSGKSTLINDTLYQYSAGILNRANTSPAPFKAIKGIEHFDKVIAIDQSPIGRTPRSNPATYTGLFTSIRDLFAATNEARSRGYTPGRFSFNVKGGRCEACQGDGVIKVEMHFLADIYVPCDVCRGKRYNRETLEIKYKSKNIEQILAMTIEEAYEFFSAIPALKRKLQTLLDVGLSYIKLGQSATTLSGGEAQRVKLSRELSKRDTGKTLYILDEPTTGLHFFDIKQLLQVLSRLRDHGNTVVIIEHNLDVIKTADWIIDIGPEGGHKGGIIIDCTTPEKLIKNKNSYTGEYLTPYLNPGKRA